ncbi:peptide-methionine (S)-S-oxide reductase MsrA [Campylobacter taeniopygiae]|uniref:Peptide methionine sulfoxide reductase MsrA n=1 Tax=Campylobacter taeniopygiae TaxID=2510188 RepID=A0ABY2THR2_9BACT|nr:peptide-methionine (S)-S-oxide reductase MsrA [Campylobacter taeniopygiae]TKX33644.1 peptide-methionine (S)-S-oxide reductase [Campylobacter taeniopygiae]
MKSIILGGGCFWCIQAVFENIKGVVYSEVGYTGGAENPTYESVCSGDGNIEVVKLNYNDVEISLIEILDIFFKIHDPTSIDKQGADIGIQYRSAIFYENENDEILIKNFIEKIKNNYSLPIVTQIYKLNKYYSAESYHQNYFTKNPNQSYCQFVIAPKLQLIRDKLSN